MQLVHGLAARGLMQPVNVLGDHGLQLALLFQLCQTQVCGVGLGSLYNELIAVKPVELFRVPFPEGVAENGLRRVVVFLVIQPIHTAEIRDAALGGHSRPAKKDDAAALCQNLFQCLYHKRKRPFPHG